MIFDSVVNLIWRYISWNSEARSQKGVTCMKDRAAILIICIIVTLAAIVWGARAQPGAVQSSAKWEYKIVSHASLAGIKSMEDVWAIHTKSLFLLTKTGRFDRIQ